MIKKELIKDDNRIITRIPWPLSKKERCFYELDMADVESLIDGETIFKGSVGFFLVNEGEEV